MVFRKALKLILKTLGGIILFFVIYFICVVGLSYIGVNTDFKNCEKDFVTVYVLSNGVHTDLVVPIKNDIKDWTQMLHPSETKSGDTLVNYAAFGWGDKGFYLETPTWADLKFKTAFKAMFFLSTTAMHVTFYKQLAENASCKKICISRKSYTKLVNYINDSFETKDNIPELIKGAGYADHDLFYDAKGTYSLFFTCNSWTNNGLKAANLRACLWTLFDKGILYQYRK